MSDSSIARYPVIEEPSKDWPFSKMLSMFFADTARFFRKPFMSVNCNLTNLMSFSWICWTTFVTASFQAGFLKFFIFLILLLARSPYVMENRLNMNVYKGIAGYRSINVQ